MSLFAVVEKVVNLLLDVPIGSRLADYWWPVVRPDSGLYHEDKQRNAQPYADHDEPEAKGASLPTYETTNPELEPERQRHVAREYQSRNVVSLIRSLFIRSLLRPCSPTTVTRLVIPINIDAVDGPVTTLARPSLRVGWALPHILEEILKSEPPLTDGNPTAAVIGVFLLTRVQAAFKNAAPDPIDRRFTASVATVQQPSRLLADTSTTESLVASQVVTQNDFGVTAVAIAKPKVLPAGLVWSPRMAFNCDQSAKALALYVNKPPAWFRAVAVAGKLIVHLEALLSGVMRTAVDAARPLLFYPMEARHA